MRRFPALFIYYYNAMCMLRFISEDTCYRPDDVLLYLLPLDNTLITHAYTQVYHHVPLLVFTIVCVARICFSIRKMQHFSAPLMPV